MKPIAQSKIIICGIVRDAEKGLLNNIPIINELCKKFEDFRIFIYENDSKDKTKNILQSWKKSNPERIHVSVNITGAPQCVPLKKDSGDINPFFSYKRISKMANLRNTYMEYIDNMKWEGDYLMIVDLDVAQLFLSPILSSFSTEKEWDAVCAFGYSTSPTLKRRYHDSYALIEYGEEQSIQTENQIKKLSTKYGSLKPNHEWIRIASGFGGLTIYRFEAVRGLRYEALKNWDLQVEVKCEHYSLYKQMKKRGYELFYLNPGMYLNYQSLSLKLIIKTLKRKFKF